jgi:hypothetical protein
MDIGYLNSGASDLGKTKQFLGSNIFSDDLEVR